MVESNVSSGHWSGLLSVILSTTMWFMAKPNNMKTCVAISKALNVLDGISLGIGVPHREGDDYESSDGIDCTTNGGYYPIATAETREAINALVGVTDYPVGVESGNAMQNQKNCGKSVDALNLILARIESGCNQKGTLAQNGTCICDANAVGTECYSNEITCKGKYVYGQPIIQLWSHPILPPNNKV